MTCSAARIPRLPGRPTENPGSARTLDRTARRRPRGHQRRPNTSAQARVGRAVAGGERERAHRGLPRPASCRCKSERSRRRSITGRFCSPRAIASRPRKPRRLGASLTAELSDVGRRRAGSVESAQNYPETVTPSPGVNPEGGMPCAQVYTFTFSTSLAMCASQEMGRRLDGYRLDRVSRRPKRTEECRARLRRGVSRSSLHARASCSGCVR
jgi:hypothetical protein